jgi:hypothetical protein
MVDAALMITSDRDYRNKPLAKTRDKILEWSSGVVFWSGFLDQNIGEQEYGKAL